MKKPTYAELVEALDDLLSTEECVCLESEAEPGTCSVCTYRTMVDRARAT